MTYDQVNTIHDYVTGCEAVRKYFFCTKNVRKMQAAYELLDYKCFPPREGKYPNKEVTITQDVSAGLNVYLNWHTDKYFDISNACILKQVHRFQLDYDVVV